MFYKNKRTSPEILKKFDQSERELFKKLKVKYKFDIHGVGHDQAEQHKFKWWERAFETAAAAIEVGDGKFHWGWKLQRFFHNISPSWTNCNGTYRVEL